MQYDITEIVNKLTGDIRPTGKTEIDNERFENLKEMCVLIEDLISQIEIVRYKSIKKYPRSEICKTHTKTF